MANLVAASVPAWMDGVAVSGAQMRRQVYGGLFPSAGIVEGLAASSLPTPDMKVRLPAGLSMVDDGTGGFYPLDNPAQVDLDIAASDGSFGRYDSVIAEVVDTGDPATALYRYRVITGTAASSPVPPTLPAADQPTAKTLRIANVYVQQNAETNGKVRPQDVTVVAGITSPVPSPARALQDGIASVSFTSQTSYSQSVTFPTPFTTVPTMSVNIASGAGAAAHWDARAINVTTTGFTLFVFAPSGATAQTWSAIPVHWMATTS